MSGGDVKLATIKDVSKETGLSIGTVSRVFNNRGYISQETREKVEAAVKKLNYQPNALARSLSKSSSRIIASKVHIISTKVITTSIAAIAFTISIFNDRRKAYPSLDISCI